MLFEFPLVPFRIEIVTPLMKTNWGEQVLWWTPAVSLRFPFHWSEVTPHSLTLSMLTEVGLTCFCLCVCAMPSVGPGVRWPAHPPPVQHSASQVQEAVGPGEDPAHPLHGQPLHQGELWLPEDSRWRRPHSPRRLRRGLRVFDERI